MVPSLARIARASPALAHASAHALWPGPEAPIVVLQYTSITCPVSVISSPAGAFGAAACAASGRANSASTAAEVRIRFNIAGTSCDGFVAARKESDTLGRGVRFPRPSYIRRGHGFQIGVYLVRHEPELPAADRHFRAG